MRSKRETSDPIFQFSLVQRLVSRIRLVFAFLMLLGMALVWFFAGFYLKYQEEERYVGYLDVLAQALSQPLQYFDLADIDATLNGYSEFLDFARIEIIDRYNFVQSEFGEDLGALKPDYEYEIAVEENEFVGQLRVWRSTNSKRPIGISIFILGGSAQMLIIVIFGSTIMQLMLKSELIEPLTMLTQSIESDAIDGTFTPALPVMQRSELQQVAIAYDGVTRQAKSLLNERGRLLKNLTEENMARKLQMRLFEEALQQSKMALTYRSGESDQASLSFGGWAPPKIRKMIATIVSINGHPHDIELEHAVTIKNEIKDEKSNLSSFETHLPNGEVWQIRILQLEGNKLAVFASDETSKKQMENALHQKNKLESLGGVSSGVAHDFNNILAIISTALEQILYDKDNCDALIETATKAVDRGASIVKQLLQFVHVGKVNLEKCNLREIFESQSSALKPLLGPQVSLHIDHIEDTFAFGEMSFLQTIILNLVLNARDALRDPGGKIFIKLRKPSIGEIQKNLMDAQFEYITIDIVDSGSGIPNDIATKIFDPFFTTKPVGQGTGLGLSMAYEFLQRIGGAIYILKTSSKGTTMSMTLRKTEHETLNETITQKGDRNIMKNKSCLVVDDEDALVNFIEIYLKRLGATVKSVTSVGGALEHLDTDHFDIVLSDMYMPDGTGLDILKAIRMKSRDTKFVLMSGNFQIDIEGGAFLKQEEITELAFIEKPFKLHDLNTLMENTLTT